MRYSILLSFAAAALAIGLSTEAPAQNKGNPKKAIVAGPQEYAALRNYRQMNGVVEAVSPTSITLRVAYTHPDKVGNVNSRNPRAMQAAIAKALKNMKTDYIDFELPLIDKVAVRQMADAGGPVEFDSTGNVKPKAAAPPGGGKLPGTASSIDALSSGDTVDLHFTSPKTGDPRPQVKMIVQLKAAAAAPPMTKGKK